MWGATGRYVGADPAGSISIHAPRVGSDACPCWPPPFLRLFQSTLPVWGATCSRVSTRQTILISIHAPRVGSDPALKRELAPYEDFNPRSPCGERPFTLRCSRVSQSFQSTLPVWGATVDQLTTRLFFAISIHAPRVGSDAIREFGLYRWDISIHAPRVGSDGMYISVQYLLVNFNPRSPCGERRHTMQSTT